jgi:rhamnosyltransferase
MPSRRIAMIGARGLANYGGFETFVAELAPRLIELGHDVSVSHRMPDKGLGQGEIRGVRILYFPMRFPRGNVAARIFDLLYDWYFTLLCSFRLKCDVVYCLGLGAGLILPLARFSKSETVVNLDGLEWKRAKFKFVERAYLRASFLVSCLCADRLVIDNSRLISQIPLRFRRKTTHIPYGVSPRACPSWDPSKLSSYNPASGEKLKPGRFWLVVARLEPDNNIHTIVRAYANSQSRMPLVVVGSFASKAYGDEVMNIARTVQAEKSILFLGSIYNQEDLDMLRCACFAHIHGHSVGGTNPSLLEAMSAGNLIIAHDNPFNRELCGRSALYFGDVDELVNSISSFEVRTSEFMKFSDEVRAIAAKKYSWEEVTAAYDKFFQAL